MSPNRMIAIIIDSIYLQTARFIFNIITSPPIPLNILQPFSISKSFFICCILSCLKIISNILISD